MPDIADPLIQGMMAGLRFKEVFQNARRQREELDMRKQALAEARAQRERQNQLQDLQARLWLGSHPGVEPLAPGQTSREVSLPALDMGAQRAAIPTSVEPENLPGGLEQPPSITARFEAPQSARTMPGFTAGVPVDDSFSYGGQNYAPIPRHEQERTALEKMIAVERMKQEAARAGMAEISGPGTPTFRVPPQVAATQWRQLNPAPNTTPGQGVPYSPEVFNQKRELAPTPENIIRGDTGTFARPRGSATATEIKTPEGQSILPSRPMGQAASEEDLESLAQSLAKGELTRLRDVVSLRASNAGSALRVFSRARQLNPKFSTAEIERKIRMESDFTAGKDGQNLQSFGIFLEHAAAASEAIQRVRQTNSPLVNRPINWWKKNVSGDPTFQSFMVSLEPVRKEFEQFLLGGRALYAEDRRAAETILNDNSTMAQVQAALKQMGHTAKARYSEMNYRYKRMMGKDIEDPFSPEAIEAASKLGVDLTSTQGTNPINGRSSTKPNQNGRREQKSPSTGQYRYSLDGGSTWLPGRLPQ